VKVKGKGKRLNTYIAPQVATAAAVVLYVRDRVGVQPTGLASAHRL